MKALSGNPSGVVYCATSKAAWNSQYVKWRGETHDPQFSAWGVTVYAENAVYLTTHVCNPLERWVRGKPVTRREVGFAAHIFAHEAMHMAGVKDEVRAECDSLRNLATTLRVHFGVKNRVALRDMVDAARWANRLAPERAC